MQWNCPWLHPSYSILHFFLTFHDSPIISGYFVLFCPVIILFLSLTLNCSCPHLYFVFVLCVSSLLFYFLSTLSGGSLFPVLLFPTSLWWSVAPVWVLQAQWAAPTLWDGVLPRPFGGPTLGGGEAGIRTIKQKYFFLACSPLLLSLQAVKKKILPAIALLLNPLWCGWWCSLQHEMSLTTFWIIIIKGVRPAMVGLVKHTVCLHDWINPSI